MTVMPPRLAVRGDAGPRSDRGGGVAAGLALNVPDCRGAGQAYWLASGSEPLVLMVEVIPRWNGDGVFTGQPEAPNNISENNIKIYTILTI